ncbi:MAG: aminotransferase class IV [Prolixibacteraceae bacterium]|nr:aminotransferase class IV [Prolixibacteraceae bacterium]
MNFLIFNGKILKFDDVTFCEFYLENSLQLTQKIWFGFGGIPLFFQNIELLISQAEILHIPLPSQVKKTDEMFRLSKRMLNKNKYYRSGFIIFKIISDGTSSHIIATSEPAAGQGLPFTDQGLLVSVSDYKKFADNNLNRYLFFNKTLWDSLLLSLRGTFFSNAVILNDKNKVCECAYGNIYLVKGDEVYTPSLSSGCYEDTFRTLISEAVLKTGKKIVEKTGIDRNDLFKMDEIFIAGENIGIQWLLGVDNKRYLQKYSSVVHHQLNILLENMVS